MKDAALDNNTWYEILDDTSYSSNVGCDLSLVYRLEQYFDNLVTTYCLSHPFESFELSDLVGKCNVREWNKEPLSILLERCCSDQDAKLNAGVALKKVLFRRGEKFLMSVTRGGTNKYRERFF